MARRKFHDTSWHQSETQWLEDGISLVGELCCVIVYSAALLIWLPIRALLPRKPIDNKNN